MSDKSSQTQSLYKRHRNAPVNATKDWTEETGLRKCTVPQTNGVQREYYLCPQKEVWWPVDWKEGEPSLEPASDQTKK